jgi:hypothetical protein
MTGVDLVKRRLDVPDSPPRDHHAGPQNQRKPGGQLGAPRDPPHFIEFHDAPINAAAEDQRLT